MPGPFVNCFDLIQGFHHILFCYQSAMHVIKWRKYQKPKKEKAATESTENKNWKKKKNKTKKKK